VERIVDDFRDFLDCFCDVRVCWIPLGCENPDLGCGSVKVFGDD
jgi:hypothetical protein